MRYSPIILFAFNRLDVLQDTVEHLKCNVGAEESILYIFVDGPRQEKIGEAESVEKVRHYVNTVSGFKNVKCKFSCHNIGLANSIINGVTEVIGKHGTVIVLEDDIEVAPGFLLYMNTMLEGFKDDKRIMQISAFSTEFRIPIGYAHDVYLNRRAESWSWATWKDRWESVDWKIPEIGSLIHNWKFRRQINDIGSDLYGLLIDSVRNDKTWAARFAYSMFKQGAYQVSPVLSLVRNGDFSRNSSNCNSYNRYKYIFNDKQLSFTVPENIQYSRSMDKAANRFWTLRYRLFGKIMNILRKT